MNKSEYRFTINEGKIKKNLNDPPTGPRPPPPKSQIAQPQRDTAKEVALMALCAVHHEYGQKLHPNLARDVQIAIEGLRESMNIKEDK